MDGKIDPRDKADEMQDFEVLELEDADLEEVAGGAAGNENCGCNSNCGCGEEEEIDPGHSDVNCGCT